MQTSNTRNLTADTLKGLAVLFMIQVHIMEQFATVEVNQSLFGKIAYFLGGPFCAPVFIAVMGYFLAASQRNFAYFFQRGLILFAGGILLNIGRSVHLFISIFQGKYNLDPLFFIFGADLLPMAGLSIILLAFVRLISKNNLLLYFSLLVVFVSLNSILNVNTLKPNFFTAFFIGKFEHSYFPLFPWFSYVLTGYIFKLLFDKFKNHLFPFTYIHWIIIMVLSLIVVVFSAFAINISNDLISYYHHNFSFYLWTVGLIIIYTILINKICILFENSLIIDFLSWTGKNVTVIYIIQWLIIGNIATAIYQTQDILKSELWFIGITFFSAVLTFIYIKFSNYLKSKNESLL